ncbi:MAG: hypothetical protein ACRD2W_22960 [Acidimicrobiales bacterium]
MRDRGFVVVQDSQRGPYEPQIGVAYALGTDGSAPTDLGAASYAVASRVPDRVWLMTDDATPDQRLRANVAFGRVRTVTEVDMEGRVTTPTRDLTEGRTVVGAVEGGLLTVRTDDVSSVAEVWDPASGHVRLAVAGTGTRFGAFADTFVDQSFAGCSLDRPMRIHHLASGRRSDVPPPPGSTWARAALSPDGRLLAAVATGLPRAGDMGASRFMGRVATAGTVFVFDTGTARLIGQHDVTIWDGGPGLVWSPDSRWVFAAADPERVTYFEASGVRTTPATLTVPTGRDFLVMRLAA